MASFLARTAGLGGNPPITNALTAQTAQSAVSAQTAQNATNAATAQNAAALGGQPPSAFLPAAGDTVMGYPGMLAYAPPSGGASEIFGNGFLQFTLNAGATSFVFLPLPRPAAAFGRGLAIKGVRVCYTADLGVAITNTIGYTGEGYADSAAPIANQTVRPGSGVSNIATCYDVAAPTPQVRAGQATLFLSLANTPGANRRFILYSVTLTLTPQT